MFGHEQISLDSSHNNITLVRLFYLQRGNLLPNGSHFRLLANNSKQVLAVDEVRRLAMLQGDVRALDSLLDKDATIFWADGTGDDNTSTLALLRSGRLRYVQLDYENNHVQLYGETAVVTEEARVTGQSDEEKRAYLLRVTRVYVRRQVSWRMVASQSTRVGPLQ
jgi:ketosteroid isomerase-like protein